MIALPQEPNNEAEMMDRIDAICDEFEAAVQTGQAPNIKCCLDQVNTGREREVLLHELFLLLMTYEPKPGPVNPLGCVVNMTYDTGPIRTGPIHDKTMQWMPSEHEKLEPVNPVSCVVNMTYGKGPIPDPGSAK